MSSSTQQQEQEQQPNEQQQQQSNDQQQQQQQPINLFDYTEEELYCPFGTNGNHDTNSSNNNSNNHRNSNTSKSSNTSKIKLTHYEILNIPIHATYEQIKKAYRKASLKYHPDKTGRDENDYVFLAVKNAYDTLSDPIKRQGYDSTVLSFDDSIPPSRATLLSQQQNDTISSSSQVYTDDDFYNLYQPVFERNLRFDARLRSIHNQNHNQNNNNNKSSKNHNKNNKNNNNTSTLPPSLGDATTSIEDVHLFYEYWIHFESWRDFSTQAITELQIQNEIENVESRYEKRYYQKEIDKRTKQLKRNEMIRIQTLVERAMEADPRLRKERQEQVLAKERLLEEKKLEKLREIEIIKQQQILQEIQEQKLKEDKINEKIQREQYKKSLRKAKQTLRKMTSSSFNELLLEQQQQKLVNENNNNNDNTNATTTTNCTANNEELLLVWEDAYDMNQDIELLCNQMSLDEIQQLNDDYEMGGLFLVQQHIIEYKMKLQQEQQASVVVVPSSSTTTNKNNKWTAKELSTLVKAIKKYPTGGAGRWDAICNMINHTCALETPRTRQECIDQYNTLLKKNKNHNKNQSTPTTTTNNDNTNHNSNEVDTTTHQNGNVNNNNNTATTSSVSSVGNGVLSSCTNTTLSLSSSEENLNTNNTNETNASTIKTNDDSNNSNTTTDIWTAEQDQLLQDALMKYPSTIDKNERWSLIASYIPGKNKKSCVQRFKYIREMLLVQQQQQQPSSSSSSSK